MMDAEIIVDPLSFQVVPVGSVFPISTHFVHQITRKKKTIQRYCKFDFFFLVFLILVAGNYHRLKVINFYFLFDLQTLTTHYNYVFPCIVRSIKKSQPMSPRQCLYLLNKALRCY